MVVSGHVLNDGTGTLVSEGDHGNKVYQMLANYQDGVIGSVNGGNGFLRVIDIDADRTMMFIRTYSPYINEFKTEFDQEFSFDKVNLIKGEPASTNTTKNDSKFEMWVAGNELFVENNSGSEINIEIFDMIGRLIFTKKKIENRTGLSLQKGYYIVRLQNGQEIHTKKVIIK
jgi:hypothetical protein